MDIGPTSDVLIGMPEVCTSSKTNLCRGTSSGAMTDVVVGVVESVKIGEVNRMKI